MLDPPEKIVFTAHDHHRPGVAMAKKQKRFVYPLASFVALLLPTTERLSVVSRLFAFFVGMGNKRYKGGETRVLICFKQSKAMRPAATLNSADDQLAL